MAEAERQRQRAREEASAFDSSGVVLAVRHRSESADPRSPGRSGCRLLQWNLRPLGTRKRARAVLGLGGRPSQRPSKRRQTLPRHASHLHFPDLTADNCPRDRCDPIEDLQSPQRCALHPRAPVPKGLPVVPGGNQSLLLLLLSSPISPLHFPLAPAPSQPSLVDFPLCKYLQ